jgi:hypothetical protein
MGDGMKDAPKQIWKALPRGAQNVLAFFALTAVLCVVFWSYRYEVLLFMLVLGSVVGELIHWGHQKNHAWVHAGRKHMDKAFDRETKREGATWADRS